MVIQNFRFTENLQYKGNTNFNLHLSVPQCTVKKARLIVAGKDKGSYKHNDCAGCAGQFYYIDDTKVSWCCTKSDSGRMYHCDSYNPHSCGCTPADITKNIPFGVHNIEGGYIDNSHILFIEAFTSSAAKNMVLYSDDYSIWIPETTKSLTLDNLMSIIGPCYPREINIEAMLPQSNFNVIKATAIPISVNVTDSCGNSIDCASVQVAFENGDTTLLLAHVNEGIYNGTWVPWNVGHCNVTITAIPASWQTLEPESVIINGTVNLA